MELIIYSDFNDVKLLQIVEATAHKRSEPRPPGCTSGTCRSPLWFCCSTQSYANGCYRGAEINIYKHWTEIPSAAS